MVHMDDHDLNAPPVPVAFDPKTNKPLPSEENKAGTGGSATHQSEVNQTYLETICSLGFTEHQVYIFFFRKFNRIFLLKR